MNYTIIEIEKQYNKQIENVIRTCLIEYNANHEGTAWCDPDLGRFSEIYNTEGNKYFIALNQESKVVGGVGIGYLKDGLCELQKMYCLKEARGTGIAKELLNLALDYAKKYYKQVYLETLDNMVEAHRFYEKNGFKRTNIVPIKTAHFACEIKYILDL